MGKKEKTRQREKRKEKKRLCPSLELSPFMLSQLELTQHIGSQSMYVSRV